MERIDAVLYSIAPVFCLAFFGMTLVSAIFFLPLAKLLHLSLVTPLDVLWTAFFLGLQSLVNLVVSYYNSMFMVVEHTHRGLTWATARRLVATLISIPLIMLRLSFPTIALGQFVAVVIVSLFSIYDLKRMMRSLPLGLQGANWKTAKATLAPSGMFAMIYTQQFLVFQAPVVMLQWILGSEIVVLFTISRTILATARLVLATLTSSVSQEITYSFAERNMQKMLKIFHYSEKILFGLIPIANLGAFLVSPILLKVWLHKPLLFEPYTYGLMALISGAMSMREHKQYFQFSTNMHKRLSLIMFFSNLTMVLVSIPLTLKFGLYGFMFTWLASELAQMGLIYHENKKLFHNDPSISFVPVLKLSLVMLVSLPICVGLVHYVQQRSLVMVGAAAACGVVMLTVESYFVFGLKDVWDEFQRRRPGRAVSGAPAV